MERLKRQEYLDTPANNYFWRTYTRQEIDFVEERQGHLFGYEMKWGEAKPKPPKLWQSAYPESSYELINRENYLKFIT
jgi:hypothetical protein